MPEILGFHHLSLTVTDLARSTQWYQSVLGLDLVAEIEGEGFSRMRLCAPNSGTTLSLTAHNQRVGENFDERGPGMDHVAFQVGPGDVDTLKRRFEELGVEHSEVKASAGGGAMITFRDPDYIQLEIFGDPSRT